MATRAEAGMPLGIPSERDTALADRAGRALDALIDGTEPVSARFDDQTADLPAPALRLLREILDWMAQGTVARRRSVVLALGLALGVNAMGIVVDAVEDRVGDRGLSEGAEVERRAHSAP